MAKKSNGLGRLLAAAAVVGAAAAGTYYYLKNRENSTDSEKTGGGEDFDEFDIFDDEDLYRNHHLEQYKTEAEITALEVQSSKCIACHSCCKNCAHYSEEDQKQCILVQKQEVHVIDNRNKCVFSPYFRENGERIYRCCFSYRFKSCQDHPDKWHKHRNGHNDQYDMY